jgi:hypothetical protein
MRFGPDTTISVSRDGKDWTPLPGVVTDTIRFTSPDPATPDKVLTYDDLVLIDGTLIRYASTSFKVRLHGLHKSHPLIKVLGIRWPSNRRAARRAHRKAMKKRGRR